MLILLSLLSFATSETFTTIGPSSLTIPAGVLSINVKLWGAGGGSTSAKSLLGGVYGGGSGAYVSCDMAVTGGTTIYLLVGQGGQVPSSYGANSATSIGGGGSGISHGNTAWSVGGGGGRTAIQLTNGVDSVVAGGGGGGGGCHSGHCGTTTYGIHNFSLESRSCYLFIFSLINAMMQVEAEVVVRMQVPLAVVVVVVVLLLWRVVLELLQGP